MYSNTKGDEMKRYIGLAMLLATLTACNGSEGTTIVDDVDVTVPTVESSILGTWVSNDCIEAGSSDIKLKYTFSEYEVNQEILWFPNMLTSTPSCMGEGEAIENFPGVIKDYALGNDVILNDNSTAVEIDIVSVSTLINLFSVVRFDDDHLWLGKTDGSYNGSIEELRHNVLAEGYFVRQ